MGRAPLTEQFLVVGKEGLTSHELAAYLADNGMETVRPLSANVTIAEMPADQPLPLFNNTASVYSAEDDRAITMHKHETPVMEGITQWRRSRQNIFSKK